MMFSRFFNRLNCYDLSRKTLKEYIDNVWGLGGTIIKDVSISNEHKEDPLKRIIEAVEKGGVCPSILPAGVNGSCLLLKGCAKSLRNFLKASSRRANNKERLDKL